MKRVRVLNHSLPTEKDLSLLNEEVLSSSKECCSESGFEHSFDDDLHLLRKYCLVKIPGHQQTTHTASRCTPLSDYAHGPGA